MRLNLEYPLGLPFLSQAFGLRGFADRAVPLSAIEAIKWMAVLAMRLLRIDVAGGRGIFLGALRHGHRVQVLRVHARTISTDVIHHMAFRNGSVREPQGHSMCAPACAAEEKDAVAVSVSATAPEDAVSVLNAKSLKSRHLFVCGHLVNGVHG